LENAALDAQKIARISESFSRQSLFATLGAQLSHVSPGEARIRFPRNEAFLQQHGYLHGGVSTALVDSACGYAALTLAPPDCAMLTIEFKANFLRPASGQWFEACGKVVKPGRTVMFCSGEVRQLDEDEKLIVTMSATMIVQTQ
jgi:uncharacterized protein (TIGR00369 family)